MALITVKAPQEITEIVVGVTFVKGVAQVDPAVDEQRRALAYFRRHNYVIEEPAKPAPAVEEPETSVFEPVPGAPSRGASKADWKTFATTAAPEGLRLTEEQAEALTRDQLADKYLGPKED
jgi:hypothetical protein